MTAIDVWMSGIGIGIGIGFIGSLLVMAGLKAFGRALLGLGVVLALTVPLSAQFRYLSFEQLSVTGTAGGFTAATINQGDGHGQADMAVCTVSTAQIRYRIDGTAPTSTVGVVANIGDTIVLNGNQVLNAARFIRTTSTSAVVDCNLAGL